MLLKQDPYPDLPGFAIRRQPVPEVFPYHSSDFFDGSLRVYMQLGVPEGQAIPPAYGGKPIPELPPVVQRPADVG